MALQDQLGLSTTAQRIASIFANIPEQNVLQRIREVFLSSIEQNFEQQGNKFGPWKPRKDNKPHPILTLTGALRKAATGKGPGHTTIWAKDGFSIGVDPATAIAFVAAKARPGGVGAAAVHNYGGGFIPQREFMVVRDEHVTRGVDILREHFNQELARA